MVINLLVPIKMKRMLASQNRLLYFVVFLSTSVFLFILCVFHDEISYPNVGCEAWNDGVNVNCKERGQERT
jgi:hypothetical protein